MRRNVRGFTLMELMLVIAIVAIISVAGFASYFSAITKSHDTQRKNDLNQIAKAIELYNNDVGSYPSDDDEGGMKCQLVPDESCGVNGSDIISAKVKGVVSEYMQRVPSDPDGLRRYYYEQTDSGGFALYAALENEQDKDWVDSGGSDWGISCASSKSGTNCNYKLTENGVVRTN